MSWKFRDLGKYLPSRKATLEDVEKAVGPSFFVSLTEMCETLQCDQPKQCSLQYSRRAVAECGVDCRPVFFPKLPLSLRDLYERFPKEFCGATIWKTKAPWLEEKDDAGYRLTDLKLKHTGSTVVLEQVTPKSVYAPAKLATIAQLLLYFRLKRNIRLLSKKLHCGFAFENPNDPWRDQVPMIGAYDRTGILVTTMPLELGQRFGFVTTGMMVCRVPDKK